MIGSCSLVDGEGPEKVGEKPEIIRPIKIAIKCLSMHVNSELSTLGKVLKAVAYTGERRRSEPVTKCILENINIRIPKGSLTAIVGPSGGGKTSLLDVISGQFDDRSVRVNGTISFTGVEESQSVSMAYATQESKLISTLTIRECLGYSADLTLPHLSRRERSDIVEQIILDLKLGCCANTRVGDCSGGEIRRAGLGVQLVASPSCFLCDEPTTGLDATCAHSIMAALQRLTRNGRTVAVSLHTPRPEIWEMFDSIVLLAQGGVLYSGPTHGIGPYLSSVGFDLPLSANTAEYLIDLVSVDYRSQAALSESTERVAFLKERWQHRSSVIGSQDEGTRTEFHDAGIQRSNTTCAPFMRGQICALTRRTIKTTMRDPIGMIATISIQCIVATIMGFVFFQVDESQRGIRTRQSALFCSVALIHGYLVLLYELFRLSNEIHVFDYESREAIVNALGFVTSRRAAKACLEDIPACLLSCIIFFFMVGFQSGAARFFVFFVVHLFLNYITLGLALVCVAIDRRYIVSSILGTLIFTVELIACGNFVQIGQIPVYARWLKWVDPFFYAFSAVCYNEYVGPAASQYGHLYECPYSSNPSDPRCEAYTGVHIIRQLGFPEDWVWKPIMILLGSIAIVHFLGIMTLHYKRSAATISGSEIKSHMQVQSVAPFLRHTPTQSVHIHVQQYSLTVSRRAQRSPDMSTTKAILRSVSAEFHPGKLNVIMGPSGSGKSTLLKAISGRRDYSLLTEYEIEGKIEFNGVACLKKLARAICSYVDQAECGILPFMTVRETLHHAARLRLPKEISAETCRQRAESIIQRVRLQMCADTIIGDRTHRGISGGEMRRVSIAIQLLSDPHVLVLDEPVSGLDAFAAMTVFDVLVDLAAEGRTVVLSVHQPRSDMYGLFSNLLLLRSDGSVAYTGNGEKLLEYIREHGYGSSRTHNPAD